MNKYQKFAVNHYLSRYSEDMSFEDVLAASQSDDLPAVMPNEAYHHLTLEEIADDIYQMACRPRETTMNLLELTKDFTLKISRHPEENLLELNRITVRLDDDELEELEYGLTNLLHAISVYKREKK
jgi:hypothetical protein